MKFESSCEMGRVCERVHARAGAHLSVNSRICSCVCVRLPVCDVFKAQVSYESRLITAL